MNISGSSTFTECALLHSKARGDVHVKRVKQVIKQHSHVRTMATESVGLKEFSLTHVVYREDDRLGEILAIISLLPMYALLFCTHLCRHESFNSVSSLFHT